MRPENLLHRINNIFGYKDIDFQDRPIFSKQYLLKGDDSSGHVSLLFSNLITEYFEKHKGLSIETYESGMLVYFDDRRLARDEISVFLRQARNIYSLFDSGAVVQDYPQTRGTGQAVKPRLFNGKIYSCVLLSCLCLPLLSGIQLMENSIIKGLHRKTQEQN